MRVAPRCATYKMTLIALVLLAYLLGSVSFGVLASRIFHLPDPRSYGSKNPGATNVLRSGKKTAAAFTLLGDAGKGWVAVVLARYAGPIPGVDMDATAPVELLLGIILEGSTKAAPALSAKPDPEAKEEFIKKHAPRMSKENNYGMGRKVEVP